MRSKPALTPVWGTALAAVAAGSLLAFSLVAQQTGLGNLGLSDRVASTAPGVSSSTITLPGGTAGGDGAGRPGAEASEGSTIASAPLATPSTTTPTTAVPDTSATADVEPSFDLPDLGRRAVSAARPSTEDSDQRGKDKGRPIWARGAHDQKKVEHGRRSGAARFQGDGPSAVPPGHSKNKEQGRPATPPGHSKEKHHGHGNANGHSKNKH
jgi:hypothetical protein